MGSKIARKDSSGVAPMGTEMSDISNQTGGPTTEDVLSGLPSSKAPAQMPTSDERRANSRKGMAFMKNMAARKKGSR